MVFDVEETVLVTISEDATSTISDLKRRLALCAA